MSTCGADKCRFHLLLHDEPERRLEKSTMADWFGGCWCWLRCRCRRPDTHVVVVTALFLVLIAVRRRETTPDVDRSGAGDQRRTVRHDTGASGESQRAEQQQPAVVGVFLLVDLDDVEDHQWNQTVDESLPPVHTRVCNCFNSHLPGTDLFPEDLRGRVKLLSASMKRCIVSLKRFKVPLQPASGRGIRRWRPRIGVFCLFCCKIGLI